MKHMTVIPPSAPFKKSPGTRNTTRADGEWVEDATYPAIRVKGGEIRYGVVRDGSGDAWGRWCFVEVKL